MNPQSTLIVRTNPPALAKPPGYSHVVESAGGKTIWISGQVALDAEGQLVGAGDPAAQAEQVFRNLEAALAAAGARFADVVKMTTFVTDPSCIAPFREARNRFLQPEHAPASTLVQVVALVRPEWMIEIEAVAVVPA